MEDRPVEEQDALERAETALALAQAGCLREAAFELAALASVDPERSARLHALAGALFSSIPDDPESLLLAEAHLSKAEQLGLREASVANRLGWVALARGDWATARTWFEEAIRREGSLPSYRVDLAAVLLDGVGPVEEARRLCEEALSMGDDTPRAHGVLGTALARMGDFRGAQAHLREALRRDPHAMTARLALARVLANHLDGLAEAEALLDEVDEEERGAEWWIERALLAARRRDFAMALRCGREALERAERQVSSAIRSDQVRRATLVVGQSLLVLGQAEQAEQAFQRGIEEQPDDPEMRLGLAAARKALGRREAAREVLETAVATGATHPALLMEAARLSIGTPQSLEWAALAVDNDEGLSKDVARRMAQWRALLGSLPELLRTMGVDEGYPVIRSIRIGHNSLLACVGAAKEDFFVKAYFEGQRTPEQIEYTHRLMQRLRNEGLPVPEVVEDGAGRSVWRVPGAGLVTVLRRLPGSSLPRPAHGGRRLTDPDQAREMGRMLGRLHRATTPIPEGLSSRPAGGMRGGLAFFLEEDWRRALSASLSVCGSFLPWVEHHAPWLISACEQMVADLAPFRQRLTRCVIHGDFSWHNCLWTDGKPVGIVDFDYACPDAVVADIATAIHRVAFSWRRGFLTGDPLFCRDLARALLEGYSETGPWTETDRFALETALIAVRIPYFLSMIAASFSGEEDPTSGSYADGLKTLHVLEFQYRWLSANRPLVLVDPT